MRGQATLTKDEAEKLVQSACAAMATELDRLRAALAEAERERDEARARRDFARDGEENIRFLLKLWQQECDFYRSKCFVREAEIKRQRRTIRALVVAARAIHRTLWSALDQYDVNNEGIEREMRQHVIGLRWEMQQSERGQAGKE